MLRQVGLRWLRLIQMGQVSLWLGWVELGMGYVRLRPGQEHWRK